MYSTSTPICKYYLLIFCTTIKLNSALLKDSVNGSQCWPSHFHCATLHKDHFCGADSIPTAATKSGATTTAKMPEEQAAAEKARKRITELKGFIEALSQLLVCPKNFKFKSPF